MNLHNLSHCELQPTFLLSKDIWSLRTEAWKLPQPFLSIKVKNAMNKKRRHFWHCFVFCKVAKTQLGSSSSLLGNLYIKWTDSNSWVLSLIFLLSWTFLRSLNCQQLRRTSCWQLRSSTCPLTGFFWLLSHDVIYLKLTRVL